MAFLFVRARGALVDYKRVKKTNKQTNKQTNGINDAGPLLQVISLRFYKDHL
jgi:hypothetical protein